MTYNNIQRDDMILSRIEYELILNKSLKYDLIYKKIRDIINNAKLGYSNPLSYDLDELKPLIECLFINEINDRLSELNVLNTCTILTGEANE